MASDKPKRATKAPAAPAAAPPGAESIQPPETPLGKLAQRIKAHPLSVIAVASVGGLTAFALMFDALEKGSQAAAGLADRVFGESVPSAKPVFTDPPIAGEAHRLTLVVAARFADAAFAAPEYVASLGRPRLVASDGTLVSDDAVTSEFKPIDGRWEATTALLLPRRPAASERFVIRLAQHTSPPFTLADVNWAAASTDGQRSTRRVWSATARHEVVVPAPTWPVLKGARLIRGTPSTLELFVENHASTELALTDVVLQVSHGLPLRSCWQERGVQQQRVVLSWERALAHQSKGSSWTQLEQSRVPVETRQAWGGDCSAPTFTATIPTQGNVPARSLARLGLVISEAPTYAGKRIKIGSALSLKNPFGPPESILVWDHVLVSVKGSSPIHPEAIEVRR